MPSTLQLCKHKWKFMNLPNLLPGKTRQVMKGRKGWRKAKLRNLQRRAARPTRTKKMSLGHKERRENMGRLPTLVLISLMKTSLTPGVTALAEKRKQTMIDQCLWNMLPNKNFAGFHLGVMQLGDLKNPQLNWSSQAPKWFAHATEELRTAELNLFQIFIQAFEHWLSGPWSGNDLCIFLNIILTKQHALVHPFSETAFQL